MLTQCKKLTLEKEKVGEEHVCIHHPKNKLHQYYLEIVLHKLNSVEQAMVLKYKDQQHQMIKQATEVLAKHCLLQVERNFYEINEIYNLRKTGQSLDALAKRIE